MNETTTPTPTPPAPAAGSATEIWVCVRTRACGWEGPESARRDVPAKRQPGNGLHVTEQRCPRCNGRAFYVRQARNTKRSGGGQ